MDNLNSIYYKDIYNIECFIKDKSHLNMIIYDKKYDKLMIIKNILKSLYKKFYVIDKFDYDYIINIVKTQSIDLNTYKYFVFYNCKMNKTQISIIKNIMEKYYLTTRVIIITDNMNNINESIKSQCYMYKFSEITKYDDIINNNDCIINMRYNICDDVDDQYYNIVKKLFNIYQKRNIGDIKLYCYNVKLINIDNTILLRTLLNYIISEISLKMCKMYEIVMEISNYEYMINKSYKDIIYLESLFIRIYKILYIND